MSDPGTIVISLGPLSDYLKPILDQAVPPIATAIVGIGVYYLRKWANIKISDSDAAQIQKATANAAASMVAKAEDNLAHTTVTTKDPRVGAAADFVAGHYKDTLKGLGVTQDDVAHQIVAEVGKLQATMTTAPVAKNPPAPQPAALPAGVVAVLALILSVGVLMGAGGHAWAANLGPVDRFPGTSSPAIQLPSITGAVSSAVNNLGGGDPISQLSALFSTDAASAEKLAVSLPDLQDGNGAACWAAGEDLATVLKAHPLPLTGQSMTDLEALRLDSAAAEKMCSTPACTQVFSELANGVAQLGLGIPIPSLSSLCVKIPHIAMVPATPVPAAPQ